MTRKYKGKTAIARDESRLSKPAAPSSSGRARSIEPHVVDFPERGPRKTDRAPAAAKASKGGRVKPPVTRDAAKPAARMRTAGSYEPQQRPPQAEAAASSRQERYIRLRIRVRDGQLSVVDSHLVDGPLAQARSFSGSNAYEVTLDGQLLHAGELPDLGVQRSFVNPDPKAPRVQKQHHIVERRVYEFMARVPAPHVTPDTIGRITVRLHRLKEPASTGKMGDTPLLRQFEREMRPVAELVGLPESVLPEAMERRGARTPTIA